MKKNIYMIRAALIYCDCNLNLQRLLKTEYYSILRDRHSKLACPQSLEPCISLSNFKYQRRLSNIANIIILSTCIANIRKPCSQTIQRQHECYFDVPVKWLFAFYTARNESLCLAMNQRKYPSLKRICHLHWMKVTWVPLSGRERQLSNSGLGQAA